MMIRQSEEFDAIQKSFKMDEIGEEYVCSMVRPLFDLLNGDHSSFIKVDSKIRSIRLLMLLEYYMNKGSITSTSNYKIFIDLLLDAKVLRNKKK